MIIRLVFFVFEVVAVQLHLGLRQHHFWNRLDVGGVGGQSLALQVLLQVFSIKATVQSFLEFGQLVGHVVTTAYVRLILSLKSIFNGVTIRLLQVWVLGALLDH